MEMKLKKGLEKESEVLSTGDDFSDYDASELYEEYGEESAEERELMLGETSGEEKKDKFYFIFGEEHLHPDTDECMAPYWVEVEGSSYKEAFVTMVESLYGMRWKSQFWEHEFKEMKDKFPGGCYERNPTKVSNPLEKYVFPNIEDL